MTASSIFDGFEEYRFPSEKTVDDAFKTGLVVLDANVLLNLYKMDAPASEAWLSVLGKLGSRLWVSHQALAEFWRNRSAAAVHPQVAYQTRNKLVAAHKSIKEEHRKWQVSRGVLEEDNENLAAALTALDDLTQEVDGFIEERTKRFSADPEQDYLVKRLGPILSGRVGLPFPEQQKKKLHEEADRRYAAKIPPGYMDDGNNSESRVGKSTDKKYGDYVLWSQTLEHAKSVFNGKPGSQPLLLVTADFKEDWWRKSETASPAEQGSGTARAGGARYELIVEAREVAGATLILQSPTDFIRLAAQWAGIDLSQDIIDSTDAASSEVTKPEDEEPTRVVPDRLFAFLGGEIVAEGHDHEDGFLVESGRTRSEATNTTPAGTIRLRERLLDEGTFIEIDEGNWELTKPYLFSSASAAANVMLARNSNGLTEWRNNDGVALKELQQRPRGE